MNYKIEINCLIKDYHIYLYVWNTYLSISIYGKFISPRLTIYQQIFDSDLNNEEILLLFPLYLSLSLFT